ncbi:MAG: hypothetical protein EZS28_040174 [Streblomastix strix]|uniref:Uncharacterized protein n=1 Tax=Streblomastix strix TaxID=222440 RepID=A0A5J4U1X6_9EUKA|nr:MAG: hypothetical protein EZS28_040174 [Streblomastix strix]
MGHPVLAPLRPGQIFIGTRNIIIIEEFENPTREDKLFPDGLKAREGRRYTSRILKTLNLSKGAMDMILYGHSAETQLVVMGLDETLVNTYTGYARNSKSTNDYYVFAERLKDNEIATKLSDTRGQVECNPISDTKQQ